MLQEAALLSLLNGPQPVRVTIGGRAYGSGAVFSQKIFAFVPNDAAPPAIPVAAPDGHLPILGRIRMPKGLARGVVCGGRVVSWAVARTPDACGVSHITVETDVRYRGRGYARACLQALVQAADAPLLYLCDSRNTPSARTALSAGFALIGTIERDG